MKKIRKEALLICSLFVFAMLSGCGKDDSGSSGNSSRTGNTTESSKTTAEVFKLTEDEDRTTAATEDETQKPEDTTETTADATDDRIKAGRAIQIRRMMYMPGRDGTVVANYECDENGNVLVMKSTITSTIIYYTYDAAGNKTKMEQYNGDTIEAAVEYDQKGREKKRTIYDDDGNFKYMYEYTYGDHDSVESTTFSDVDGQKSVSENSLIYEYDSEGRVLVEKKNDGVDIFILNRYEYDTAGNKTKSMKYRTEWNDNTVQETHEYIYDDEGRLVFEKVFDYDGCLDRWFAEEYSDGSGVVDENVRKKMEGEFYIEQVDSIEMKDWMGKDLNEYLNTHPGYEKFELYNGYSYLYDGLSIASYDGTTIQYIGISEGGKYSINGVMVGMNFKKDADYRFDVGNDAVQKSESDREVVYNYRNGNVLRYTLDGEGNIIEIAFYYE